MADSETWQETLRAGGYRLTPQRELVLTAVDTLGHATPDQVYAEVRRHSSAINLSTVYRTLELLVRSGLVRKQRVGARGQLFEHVHPGQQHDHLVCSVCGRVVEFVSPGITALQAEICRAHGFSPDHHQLQILGLCNDCRAQAAAQAHA